jgi:hypothetical protein
MMVMLPLLTTNIKPCLSKVFTSVKRSSLPRQNLCSIGLSYVFFRNGISTLSAFVYLSKKRITKKKRCFFRLNCERVPTKAELTVAQCQQRKRTKLGLACSLHVPAADKTVNRL